MCNQNQTYPHNITEEEAFCDAEWDSVFCWPATKANTTVTLPCPMIRGSNHAKSVSRFCRFDGQWSVNGNLNDDVNFTENINSCFRREIITVVEQLTKMSKEELALKIQIAKCIRILEMLGLTLSMLTLMLSFAIYTYFRTLRNERTRIHINLMGAVLCNASMKLMIFIDQFMIGYGKLEIENVGIDDTPVLCELAYIVLEYSKSATYAWMLIEALHVYNAVAVTAKRMTFKKFYLILGWGASFVSVSLWAGTMVMKTRIHCWWGYDFLPYFWILEIPRMFVLLMNTFYLIQIIKVVFIKLRRETCSEIEKIRKVTKSTMALLPLFGITNYFSYARPDYTGPLWYFILYCFITYFLSSFQGMFISLMYCLLNREVKETVSKMNFSLLSWNSREAEIKPQKPLSNNSPHFWYVFTNTLHKPSLLI